jgi:hypothetical protein
MLKQTFSILDNLTSLNTYINAERSHWSLAAKIKKNETAYCCEEIMVAKLKPFKTPVTIHYHWYIHAPKSDLDNAGFAIKFINDALVGMKILPDDNIEWIKEIRHTFLKVKGKKARKGVDVIMKGIDV